MHRTPHLLLMAAAIAGLTGCGQLPSLMADLAAANVAGTRSLDGKLDAGATTAVACGAASVGFMPLLDADLGLTEEQQAKLKALQPDAPQLVTAKAPGAPDAVRKAFLADPLDVAALRAALEAQQADRVDLPQAGPTKLLVAMREILTEEQRAKLVAKLQAQPAPTLIKAVRPKIDLKLDATQQAALDAVLAKLEPPAPPDPRAGMIAFWQSGDTSGLEAPKPPALPVDEIVQLAQLLDVEDRKALLEQALPFGGGMAVAVSVVGRPGEPGGTLSGSAMVTKARPAGAVEAGGTFVPAGIPYGPGQPPAPGAMVVTGQAVPVGPIPPGAMAGSMTTSAGPVLVQSFSTGGAGEGQCGVKAEPARQ